jgi:hypothetical protein
VKLESILIDHSIVAEMFSTFDPEILKGWHIDRFKTRVLEITNNKRVFEFSREFKTERSCNFNVKSPSNEVGSLLIGKGRFYPYDRLVITWTVVAHDNGGGGGGGIRVRMPWGKIINIKIYSMAG